MSAVTVRFLGGTFDGIKADLLAAPKVLFVGRCRYERIDDPDSGEFLGGYAFAGRRPPPPRRPKPLPDPTVPRRW